jgi:uncharacterized protein
VSGTRVTEATVFAIEQRGPDAWTGGAFGPEAGILGVIAIGIGMAVTVGWVRWRRGVVALEPSLADAPVAARFSEELPPGRHRGDALERAP